VSDLDQSSAVPPQDAIADKDERFVGLLGDRPAPEREGLPRNYRMRADSHYVDQLESRRGGPAVRLIPTRQIDTTDLPAAAAVTTLAQSIAAHGVLQPLLVRRQGARYHVIAGRRRLAAAVAAGLPDVPCVTYDVGESEAAALAEADNLHAPAAGARATEQEWLPDALQNIATDVGGIGLSLTLLRSGRASGFQYQVAAELMQAQIWRAAWLSKAVALVAGPARSGRLRPIGTIIDRVTAGFESEARLTRLRLDCSVAPEAAPLSFDDDMAATAITGALLATLAWLKDVDEPRIELRVDTAAAKTLRIEVAQRSVPIAEDVAAYLRAPARGRLADLIAMLGLLAARSFAAEHHGAVESVPIGAGGGALHLTASKSEEN
jgi:hypothetical protein